ncbi:MAG: hypothetical protein IPK63_10835 [Candidatus Competibacteraceae bacterium]|nr:hypothetical protein [Candidatus Competibacteraceae bacterium]
MAVPSPTPIPTSAKSLGYCGRHGFRLAETAYTRRGRAADGRRLERTHRLGFKRVVVFPYLLFTGRLVEQVRATVADYRSRHPDVRAVVAPYLNAHPLVVATFLNG